MRCLSPTLDPVSTSRPVEGRGKRLVEEQSPRPRGDMLAALKAHFIVPDDGIEIEGQAASDSLATAALRVYRHTILSSRLVGWVDSDGLTYRRELGGIGRLTAWSVDEDGVIYFEFAEVKTIVGWTDAGGVLYDRYLLDYRTLRAQNGPRAPWKLVYPNRPRLLGFVKSDGMVYRSRPLRSRRMGQVTGTSDIRLTGGLALVLLFD